MKRTRERSTTTRPRRWLPALAALALLLASSVASALGLGQIELRSRIGEPLLAEIPIVSNDPRELQQLRVGLASSDTFARIGLQPPAGVVAKLQFASALDARGNPVIRVTSREPITEPLLTFLVEVDWGQGRLVREYSVLLDTPRTVAAPLQPPIQAPQAAPSNTIVREELPEPPASEPEPGPVPPSAAEPGREPPAPEAVEAEPRPDPSIAPQPALAAPPQAPAPASEPPPVQDVPRHGYGEVRRGETLSEIADSLDLGVSLDQAMIALLRANPEAFIDDNVNLLKAGVVLRVPDRAELAAVDAVQASALVRSQVRQWRQAKQAVPQPVAAGGDSAAPAGGDGDRAAGATPGARLEIVPPGASDAGEAGTQSGIAAGGEGEMQRELATTKETLAAREAELAEMKSRVAELEQLQAQQKQLLEMQDTELAAVEQRLAEARADDAGAGGSLLPWLVGGAIGLALALLAAWLLRRRSKAAGFRAPSPARSPRPSVADSYSLAPSPSPSAPGREPVDDRPQPAAPAAPTPAPQSTPGPAPDADESRPFWDRRERPPLPSKRAPTWHAGPAAATAVDMAGSTPGVDDDGAGAQERLELARAYLDLGDRDNARQLLDQVAVDGDPATREQVERMRRELDR